jgi:DNA polymerase-1
VTVKLEDCHTRDFDINNVIALFRELEFRGMTNALVAKLGAPETPITVTAEGEAWRPTEVVVVRDEAALADLATRLAAAQWISFDVETDSLERLLAGVVGICLAIEPPVAYYIPIGHVTGAAQVDSGQMNLFAGEAQPAPGQLPLARVVEVIGPALRDPAIPKVAHNAKFDCMILSRHGLPVSPVAFDTMIAEWLTDPATKHKGLKDLARHRLGAEMTDIEALIGRGKTQ